MKALRLLAFATTVFLSSLVAQPTDAETAERIAAARKLAAGLKFQAGEIPLKGNLAKVSVPADFRYLDSKDASTVLSEIWGNPPGGNLLGMIVPKSFDPFDSASWVVVITYSDDGHVKDDDASTIDYSKLLADMKADTRESSKEREKKGFGAIELIGWAAAPRYDAATHKFYWAKELKFDGGPENTLNYNIRVLGREGVLVLNAVASMAQLKDVEAATPAILKMVDFQQGQRYADYNESTDKTATYGLAALVAGGAAAKAGLFKGLWLAILAGKKFIVIGVIAVAALAKKFFSKKAA